MLFNLLLNIGLLVLIATMLTNLPPVRALLLEEKQTFRSRLWLSLIFGMVSICSTYQGKHRYHHGPVYRGHICKYAHLLFYNTSEGTA